MAWARTSITVPNEWSELPQVIVFIEDITERKQTEDALRRSEERFRMAAENASDMIYEWDLRSGQVGVFGARHQHMGDWPVPLSYEAWKKLLHPEDLERLLPQFARHIQTGERYRGEYRIIGQNGKIYHFSNRGQAIRNAAGEPYKWVGLSTDITERKEAEEVIAQLAAIVQCSESAIFATDLEGAILTWNDGARKLLGYTVSEARSLPISALRCCADRAGELLSRIMN